MRNTHWQDLTHEEFAMRHPNIPKTMTHCEDCGRRDEKRLSVLKQTCRSCGLVLCSICRELTEHKEGSCVDA